MSRTTLEERVTKLEKRLAEITSLLARAMVDRPRSKKRTKLNGRKSRVRCKPSATVKPQCPSESRPLTSEDLRRLAKRFPPPPEWFDEDFDGLF